MFLSNLLKSSVFQNFLLYLVIFAISALILLGFIYWNTAGFMARQTDQTLVAEIRGLEEQFRRDGITTLAEVINERSVNAGDSLYLLTDQLGRPIAGNLDKLPPLPDQRGSRIEFELERQLGNGSVQKRKAEAHFLRLYSVIGSVEQDTGYLIVGRDVQERKQIENMITTALAWGGALMIGIGVAGGAIITRNIMARLELMNETSRQVMEGDLSQRVPLDGSGDELDRLGENLNAMLNQVETLMAAMRQVTDNVAHDLRSPLNRLRARIEYTLKEKRDPATYRQVLDQTMDEVDGLLSTFNALLSIAQIEAGTSAQELDLLDPADIARDMAEFYEPVCEEKGQHLKVEAQSGTRIKANRELVSQALSNLLDNAIKYSGEKAEIGLKVCKDAKGEEVIVAVSDSGPGIAAEDRDQVTKRFVRLETSRSEPGSGLGLSLVSAIARLHNARLVLSDADQTPRETGKQGKGLEVALHFQSR